MKKYILALAALSLTASPALALNRPPADLAHTPVPDADYNAFSAEHSRILGLARDKGTSVYNETIREAINDMARFREDARTAKEAKNTAAFQKAKTAWGPPANTVCGVINGGCGTINPDPAPARL